MRRRVRQGRTILTDNTGLPLYNQLALQIDELRATRRRLTPFGVRTWARHNIRNRVGRANARSAAALAEYDLVAIPPPSYQPFQEDGGDIAHDQGESST
jgi:hypothetical protein